MQILTLILQTECDPPLRVLEIGSGTGEHAVHFAGSLPHLIWQTSDLACNHGVILAWIAHAKLVNVHPPIVLDADAEAWEVGEGAVDAVYLSNLLHIVSWDSCQRLFGHVAKVLKEKTRPSHGHLLMYGPFNYGGQFTSESNASFDGWLKQRDPLSGIRNFETISEILLSYGLALVRDYEMPANNRLLHFQLIAE